MHPPLLHPRTGRGLHTAALLAAGLVFCLSLPFLLGSRLSEGGASFLDRWRAGQPPAPSPQGTPHLGWAQEHLPRGAHVGEGPTRRVGGPGCSTAPPTSLVLLPQ